MVNLVEDHGSACADPIVSQSDDLRRVSSTPLPNRSATLARVIEADIIPRLLLATGRQPAEGPTRALEVERTDVDAFAEMMIRLDLARANFVVAGALANGVSIETVLLELLSPTAKRLGEMWVEDLCSFTDVTVGLCALQSLLRSLTSGDAIDPKTMHDGRMMIAATPGEQHTFGVLMLETFFRRAGWDVVGMPLSTCDEILAAVGRKPFAIVGFSLSRESALGELTDLIKTVRKTSANSELSVMVGGRVFNDNPKLVRAVGADLTAADANRALVASHSVVCSRMQTH